MTFYLLIKIITFIVLIFLGIKRYYRSGERWYFAFSAWGLLNLVFNYIDFYWVESNLELLIITNLIEFGIILFILKNLIFASPLENKMAILSIIPVATYSIIVFLFDIPKATENLYSQYGYLNTLEYENTILMSSFFNISFTIYVILKSFKIPNYPVNYICFASAIFISSSQDLLNHIVSIPLLGEPLLLANLLNHYNLIKFFLFHVLTFTGLLWNR